MKKFGIILVILALCFALSACGEEIVITTPGGSYTFEGAELTPEYGNIKADAANGQSLLLVQLHTDNGNIEDIDASFFSHESPHAEISDGTTQIACKAISYSKTSEDAAGFTLNLLFEVPVDWAQEFTLSGDAFTQVALKHK